MDWNVSRKIRNKKNSDKTKQSSISISLYFICMLFIVAFDLRFSCILDKCESEFDENTYTEKFMLRCKLLLCLSIVVNHFNLQIQFYMKYVHKLGAATNNRTINSYS